MVIAVNTNHAPVLDPAPALTLGTVQEEAWLRPDSGVLVSDLADTATSALSGLDNVSDPGLEQVGLALIGAESAHGAWFYSTDRGNQWNPVGAVSDSSALVLASNGATRIAFVPAADFTGTITDAITFRAWDRTGGFANGTSGVDVTVNGGSSAFSSETDTASITVTAVNDAPVIGVQGTVDLVVTNQTGQSVSLLTGDGAGHFSAGPPQPIGGVPAAIATGDLNHDGRLDLVVADPGTNSVSVLFGNGLGGFTAAGNPIQISNPTSFALLDFNGDGNLDLAIPGPADGNGGRFIDIRFGFSDGHFSDLSSLYAVVADPIAMAVGDFDHDGRADIAVGDGSSNTVTIVSFGFGPQPGPTPVATLSARPSALAVGDLNHDGNLDIVAATAGGPEVLLARPDGSFQQTALSAAPEPTAIALGDVNNDGNLDIVAADRQLNAALVLLGDGQGGFTLSQTLPVGNVPLALALALTDLEGDGDLDIVTANKSSNSVSVLQGFGDGTFADASSVPVGRAPVALVSGNFDAQTVAVNGQIQFAPQFRNAITLSDVDANGGTETLTLSAQHGTVTPSAGTALVTGGAVGTSTVTLTGTIAELNAALYGLRYAPQSGFSGADTLTVTVNDNGHGGAGGAQTATQFVPIAVASLNQAPVLDLHNHDSFVVAINTQTALASVLGGAITVSDADSGGGSESVTVSAAHGGVRLTTLGGVTITSGSDFSASVSFSGTIAQLNAALAGLAYVPATGFTGEDTLSITINDGGHTGLGGALSASASVAITVSPWNEAPVVHLGNATQTDSEDTALVFSTANHNAITVSDGDAGGGTETVTVSADHGSVTLASLSDVTVTAGQDGSSSVTFAGTVEHLNAALDRLTYTPQQNFNGPDTLTVEIDDGGNSGIGGHLIRSGDVAITVSPVNDPPTIELQTTDTQVVARGSVIAFAPSQGNGIHISDVDGNHSNETVSLSVDHGTLFLGPNSGVSVVSGAVGSAAVTFTGTVDQLNAALLGLQYAAATDFDGKDTLNITVDDHGLTATDAIGLELVNAAPLLDTGPKPVLAQTEDVTAEFGGTLVSTLVGLFGQGGIANVTDPDGPGLGIAVTAVDSSLGTWFYSTDDGNSWNELKEQDLASDVLLLAADSETRLFFQTAPDFDGTASQAITFRAWDMSDQHAAGTFVSATELDARGAFSVVADTADVAVFGVNDEPVVQVDDTARTVSSDAALVFSGASNNAITVSDVDAHGGIETVTVSAGHGGVTLASGTGVTVTGGANGSASVTFSGTIAQLNGALDGLTYTPARDFAGSDALTITIDDNGHTGFDSPLSATKVVPITVAMVNDAPVIAVQLADQPIFQRGEVVTFDDEPFHHRITVSDPDGSGSSETVRLAIAHGSLTLAANSGATVTAGADGSGDVTFTGTLDQVNAALNGLVYQADASFNGNAPLTIEVNDGSLSASASVSFILGNRAPVLVPDARDLTLSVTEDEQRTFGSGILTANVVQWPIQVVGQVIPGNVFEADSIGLGLAVTAVDTTHGTWWYSTNRGVQWSFIDPQFAADGKVVLLAARNLDTLLFFQPEADFNGTVENAITFRAWDQEDGNANGAVVTAASLVGANSLSVDADTMRVTVAGVNDAPTITAPSGIGVAKAVAAPLTGIVFADVDAGSAPVHVEFSGPSDGVLAASSADGVTVGGTPAVLTLDGSIEAINAFIAGSHLTFTAAASGNVELDVSINDGGNSGEGGPLAASQLLQIAVTEAAVNAAPVLHPAATLMLPATEDQRPDIGAGTLVSHLINRTDDNGINNVTDSDGPGRGIAVTAVNTTHGTWLYSTDNGSHWTAIDPDLAGNDKLLLLAADTQTYLFFQPAHDFNGIVADAITFRAWDMSDGAANGALVDDNHVTGGSTPFSDATESANVIVDAVNDAPGITAPSSIAVAKHAASPLTGIVFSDDAGSAPVHVELSNSFGGLLEASSGDGVTVGGTSSFLTLDGSIEAINAFIAASHVTYTSPPNGTTSTFLLVTIDDGANAGLAPRSPGSLTASSAIELAIDAVNFNPVLTDDGTAASTLEQQSVLLNPSLTVSDLELDARFVLGDYAGASFTVARQGGADPEDAFGFDTAGASFTVNGNALQSQGLSFATFTAAAGALTIDFTSDETVATTALVNDVMQHVTYVNQSDTPPALAIVDETFSDGNVGSQGTGGPGVATQSAVVQITAVDDAPTLNAGPLSVNEFAAPDMLAGIVSLQAPDGSLTAGQQAAGQITYSLVDDAGGRFTIDDAGEIHVADGLLIDYEQAASHDVTVRAVEAGNAPVDRTFTITVNNVDPENIIGDGNANTFYGGALDDSLNGAGGDDWLQGRGGNNTLTGGAGIDWADYTPAPSGTFVDLMMGIALNGFGGLDTLSGIENVLGSSHRDILASGPGNHVIDGGADIDAVDYAVATGPVNVDLAAGTASNGFGGTDTLVNIEGVLGSMFNDTITGDAGDNVLFGYGGNDIMIGGAGSDVYEVESAGDQVIENPGEGIDAVHSSIAAYTLAANVEHLMLIDAAITGIGNGLDNIIGGDARDNFLDGAGGADRMLGGAGNDTYFVDSMSDQVVEGSGAGRDAVWTSVDYTLPDNVEILALSGSADIRATGNALANTLLGNDGNNKLDGQGGADVMIGGQGNDTYIVDNAGDQVIETPGGGADALYSSVSFLLPDNVESLYLFGTAVAGVGNALDNVMEGTAQDNVIDGRGGADIMIGHTGNDTYVVDTVGDQVIEVAGEGHDVVYATISHALQANVEDLYLAGSSNIDGTGNADANAIFGNAGNNAIDGGAGADILTGGSGNDRFLFGAGQANGDVVTDFQGNGGSGDLLVFSGYGAGATFTQDDATHWAVDGNGHHDVITFSNAATIHAGDWLFV